MTRKDSLAAIANAALYGIVDLGYCQAEDISKRCRQLIAGGAGVIQLRAKGFSEGDILQMAHELRPICAELSVPFIVNDYANVAVAVSADGVHIGQDDGDLSTARAIVGPEMIVGRSTHSVEQALAARDEGFDYGGFGPLFPTPTKKGRPGIGLAAVSQVEREVSPQMPLFCIGGITRSSLPEVLQAGAKRVVVVSDILLADDVTAVTEAIVEAVKAA